jgi:HD-GYP domain-containing protein (c-di-GMP phosphodiesterase class II)
MPREEDKAKERILRLEALTEVSLSLAWERDVGKILGLIVREASRILDGERTTLYLVQEKEASNGDGKTTKALVSYIAEGGLTIEVALDQRSIAGTVASSCRPVRLEDAREDPRFDPGWDAISGFRTRSMVAVPMMNPWGECIGVIQVLNKKNGPGFTSEDEEILLSLAAHAALALENARYLERQRQTFQSLIRGQAVAIDARDHLTAGHTWRVAAYSVELGKAMGLDPRQLELLEYAALLHDQGKLGVPDSVLFKCGRLEGTEEELMRVHASRTKEILEEIRGLLPLPLKKMPDIASSHHEKLDGSGYPKGLGGDQIPLEARILAVCDIFDALTSRRPYREPESDEGALEFLRKEAARGRVDSSVVEALSGILPRIPGLREGVNGRLESGSIMGSLGEIWETARENDPH